LTKAKEVWRKLFPLKEGERIKLLVDTQFQRENKTYYVLRKGRTGIVIEYQEGSPLVWVDFGIKDYYNIIERNRVERIEDES